MRFAAPNFVILMTACLLTAQAPSLCADEPAQIALADALTAVQADYDAQYAAGAPGVTGDVPLLLDPATVIRLTIKFSPEIRRAFERKLAEEARFDFFTYNREAVSYGVRSEFYYDRYSNRSDRSLDKTLSPHAFLRKEFYNTASASIRSGYDLTDYQDGHDANAFIAAGLDIPLFASREALQRSNDKIYQQTKVNDARLDYYQRIRRQISNALGNLAWTQSNYDACMYLASHRADLEALADVISSIEGRDTYADAEQLAATLASACAECDSARMNFEIASEYLINIIGLPFDTSVNVSSSDFDPFKGETQAGLEAIALETDEEIKTLLNSVRNAQSELDLARKGKWDTTLSLDARRDFAGSGDADGEASYFLSAGIEITHIDNRISRSLEAIALANIREYKNAIISRKREIHTNIVDSYKNLVGRMAEVEARAQNLSRYRDDYAKGIDLYRQGAITIGELILKRQSIREEEGDIAHARERARESVADLLSSTGRYEQFVDKEDIEGVDSPKPASGEEMLVDGEAVPVAPHSS